MKKIIIFILLFIEVNFVFAQNYFTKFISMPVSNYVAAKTKATANNEILVVGLAGYASCCDNYSYLLDSAGNIKWAHKYIWEGTMYHNNISAGSAFTDDKGFMVVSGTVAQALKSRILLARFDSLGNVVWAKRYLNYRLAYGLSILNKTNGEFAICAGTKLPYNLSDKWAVNFLVVDSLGNVTDAKRIGNDSIDFLPNSMKNIGNGFVIEGVCIYPWPDWSNKPFLMRLDSTGNVLYTKIINANYNYTASTGLAVTNDNKILYGFQNKINANAVYEVIKSDENLNIIWTRSFTPINFLFQNIAELPDSTYALYGWGGMPHGCKLDTAGNLIAHFFINYPTISAFAKQMALFGNKILFHSSPDGGSPVKGDIFSVTDLNFNASCFVQPFPLITASPYTLSDSSVIMNNISSYFPISIDTLFVTDTVLNYISTDLCSSSGTEEPDLNKNTAVFPNPANSFINFLYNLSSAQQISISIYNIYGQKLKTILNERQLAAEHEIKADIRDLSQGVYLVKMIFDEKEMVRKFVKE